MNFGVGCCGANAAKWLLLLSVQNCMPASNTDLADAKKFSEIASLMTSIVVSAL
jgi:hypothetical protein